MSGETVCPQCLGRNGRHNSDCVRDEADEQREIDTKRKLQAQEILDAVKLDTIERAKSVAHGWIVTALQTAANEAYMHDSRDQARAELAATTAVLARVTRDNAQLTQHLTDVQERASSLMLELQAARFELAQLRAKP